MNVSESRTISGASRLIDVGASTEKAKRAELATMKSAPGNSAVSDCEPDWKKASCSYENPPSSSVVTVASSAPPPSTMLSVD